MRASFVTSPLNERGLHIDPKAESSRQDGVLDIPRERPEFREIDPGACTYELNSHNPVIAGVVDHPKVVEALRISDVRV